MPSRQYGYQYETSPRKIKPDYNRPKNNRKNNNYKNNGSKNNASKNNNSKNNKPKKDNQRSNVQKKQQVKNKTNVVKQDERKKQNKLRTKTKVSIFIKGVIFFGIMFLIIFRNSKISESFSQIQNLKTSVTELQKENDQLEINIQNSLNLNTIEQAAKDLLGMQKVSNKQMVHISLPKKDYVEPRTEKIIIEEDNGFFENLINAIKSFFKI